MDLPHAMGKYRRAVNIETLESVLGTAKQNLEL